MPGLGPTAAIAILFPLTSVLNPAAAIIMLAGIHYGAMYGGSTTAILLNIPGEVASVPTCLDGYPMAQQGRGGVALGIAVIGSFIAGTFGVVILTFFAPVLADQALRFGPPEYFGLMVLAFTSWCRSPAPRSRAGSRWPWWATCSRWLASGRRRFKEFSAWVKTHPEKLVWSSVGPSGPSRYAAFDWMTQIGADPTKTKMVITPGAANSMTKLAGGHVVLAIHSVAEAQAMREAGKIKVLAVLSPSRLKALPDVPTAEEEGASAQRLSMNIDYLNASETRAFVEKEVVGYTEMATAIGIRR